MYIFFHHSQGVYTETENQNLWIIFLCSFWIQFFGLNVYHDYPAVSAAWVLETGSMSSCLGMHAGQSPTTDLSEPEARLSSLPLCPAPLHLCFSRLSKASDMPVFLSHILVSTILPCVSICVKLHMADTYGRACQMKDLLKKPDYYYFCCCCWLLFVVCWVIMSCESEHGWYMVQLALLLATILILGNCNVPC